MKKVLSFFFKDTTICILLFIIASIPRIVDLDQLPPGIHGDEGWTGIEARRILENGLIPAYVGSALGQPSGPFYSTALFFRLFQDNIFWLRFSMTIFGILTIPLLYVFLRLFFNKPAAFLTSIAFCLSLYHIHFSRTAFTPVTPPFFQLIAFIFLILGVKKKKTILIVLSAIFTGLGLYSYNPFILFPVVIVFPLLYNVFKHRLRRKDIQTLFLFILFVFIVSLPLLQIIVFQPSFYFSKHHIYSILNLPQVKMQENLLEKTKAVLAIGSTNSFHFFIGQKIDFVDAFGKYHNFHYLYISFYFLSVAIAFIKKQKWAIYFFITLLFFLTPNFLTYDGIYRRPVLALVPFYFLLAYGIHILFQIKQTIWRFAALASIAFIVAFVSVQNLTIYFQKFPNDPETNWIFTHELTKAALLTNKLANNETIVLFYSNRWPCTYETFRYITKNHPCENRSKEFGIFSKEINRRENILFVFLNDYIPFFQDIKNIYPNGRKFVIKDKNSIVGIVYKI